MKILFLDIDGVLNSFDNMNAMCTLGKYTGDKSYDEYGHKFDERCVRWLEYIVIETDCDIVISSTWRRAGLDKMKKMWEDRKLPGDIIDITPRRVDESIISLYSKDNPRADRGYEIQQWIDNNNVQYYCIVDDDCDMLSHQNFVKTNGRVGLDYDTTKEIVKILNN